MLVIQDQSMVFGSDKSRFTDIQFTGKRYVGTSASETSFLISFLCHVEQK